MVRWYDLLRYHIVPPVFVVVFTLLVEVLAVYGGGADSVAPSFTGNSFTCKVVIGYIVWALFWLKTTDKLHRGPPDPTGHRPTYKNNGVAYYIWTLLLLVCMEGVYSGEGGFCRLLYIHTPELLATLNIFALILCTYLYCTSPENNRNLPRAYIYYSGGELHPTLFGLDIKQLTNSRLGVMSWQILVAAYWYHGYTLHGFNMATFANFFLQSLYLFLFFYFEYWYFHTLDMTLDKAGYYLCWGCLVWVPCLYAYTSYVFVATPPIITPQFAVSLLVIGSLSVLLKTMVDLEKYLFRYKGTSLFGVSSYITATYRDVSGRKQTSKLITSGSWGVARHLNYTLEIVSTLCWTLPGLGSSLLPFLYVTFLTVLLLHRIYRDEEKCSKRYGTYWEQYCTKVAYRLIPYIY